LPLKRRKTKLKTADKKAVKGEVAAEDIYASYIADLKGCDTHADGCSCLARRQFVACSDETERNTVRDSLLVKKFGLKDESSELDALVMSVCETMSKDSFKNRVTFYYLLA